MEPDLSQFCPSAPPAQALIQVEHGDVREVRHASDSFEEPEALQGPIRVHHIQEPAQGQVGPLDDEGRADPVGTSLPCMLPLPHCCIIQLELLQTLANLRASPAHFVIGIWN